MPQPASRPKSSQRSFCPKKRRRLPPLSEKSQTIQSFGFGKKSAFNLRPKFVAELRPPSFVPLFIFSFSHVLSFSPSLSLTHTHPHMLRLFFQCVNIGSIILYYLSYSRQGSFPVFQHSVIVTITLSLFHPLTKVHTGTTIFILTTDSLIGLNPKQ